MPGGPVRVEETDGITTVVLDDPAARNALSWELVRSLSEAIEGATARGSRALVLRNTPPVFCAGGSVDELLEPKVDLEEIYRAFHALDEAPMPTVAAIDGAAIGAGITRSFAATWPSARPRRVSTCVSSTWASTRAGVHSGGSIGSWGNRARPRSRSSERCWTATKPSVAGWCGGAWEPTTWPRRPGGWRR